MGQEQEQFVKIMEDAIVGGDVNRASRQVSDMIGNGRDSQTADKMLAEVTEELNRGGHLPKLVRQFASSNFKDLDLDGNGQIDEHELKKLDESRLFNRSLSAFDHQMVKYMRANFKDMCKAHNGWGFETGISDRDLPAYEGLMATQMRRTGAPALPGSMTAPNYYSLPKHQVFDANKFVPDLIEEFGRAHLNALDLDNNGYTSREELQRFSASSRWGTALASGEKKAIKEIDKSMELIQRSHWDEWRYTDRKGATQADLEAYREHQHKNAADIPTTPGDHNLSLTIGGVQRDYMVHIPPGYDGSKPLPVLYFYHYFTGDAKDLANFSGMSHIADRENFIVVYPNAVGWLPNMWRQWNLNNSASYKVDELAFARSLMDTVEGKLNVDKKRVYLGGYSNGGMLAHELAAKLSDRVSAMACVSGSQFPGIPKPAEGVSVLMIHGAKDKLVPVQGRLFTPLFPRMKSLSSGRDFWREANGCDQYSSRENQSVLTETFTNSRTGAEVTVMTLEGQGHTYPGAPDSPCQSINASEEMWKFFSRHARRTNPR